MRLRSIYSVSINDRLAKSIYNDQGQILLNHGMVLTGSMIDRLKVKGITYIYIQDSATGDVHVEDAISEETRIKSLRSIEKNFALISKKISLGKSVNMDEHKPAFSNIVDNILTEIHGNKQAISMLSEVICYDSYVFHHSLNVVVYSLALGKKLGLNSRELHELGIGAILHDVGKMAIPIEILNKKEQLTDEEFKVIKDHPTIGFEILRKSHTISLLTAHCAYQHHERINGSGYPRKLTESEIHFYAKIIGVADVFDAVTANRVYRKAMLPHEALELLFSGAGTLFDKNILEVFRSTIAIYPIGLEVTLNDGREGIVVRNNPEIPTRPIIRILLDKHHPVEKEEIDLADHLTVTITSCETVLDQTSDIS